MPPEAGVGGDGNRGLQPIVAGTVVGFATGLAGLLATMGLFSTPVGGLGGAVGCGVTVAVHSEAGVDRVVVQSVVADVASSVLFFLLVGVTYLAAVALGEGLAAVETVWFALLYLVVGGLGVAAPVGVVSVGLAGASAAATSLALRRFEGSTAPG